MTQGTPPGGPQGGEPCQNPLLFWQPDPMFGSPMNGPANVKEGDVLAVTITGTDQDWTKCYQNKVLIYSLPAYPMNHVVELDGPLSASPWANNPAISVVGSNITTGVKNFRLSQDARQVGEVPEWFPVRVRLVDQAIGGFHDPWVGPYVWDVRVDPK